jgi:hypothetical protein
MGEEEYLTKLRLCAAKREGIQILKIEVEKVIL